MNLLIYYGKYTDSLESYIEFSKAVKEIAVNKKQMELLGKFDRGILHDYVMRISDTVQDDGSVIINKELPTESIYSKSDSYCNIFKALIMFYAILFVFYAKAILIKIALLHLWHYAVC